MDCTVILFVYSLPSVIIVEILNYRTASNGNKEIYEDHLSIIINSELNLYN